MTQDTELIHRERMRKFRKGDRLEHIVESIEKLILGVCTGTPSCITVESKKHMSIDGVLHEIDLYVTIQYNDEYSSVVIFECKDWNFGAVGKNDVIVLSEKIKATGAMNGFMVARKYSKYAKAQAKIDRRVRLLIAKDYLYDRISFQYPEMHFQCITERQNCLEIHTGSPQTPTALDDLSSVYCMYSNTRQSLMEFIAANIEPILREKMDAQLMQNRASELPEGKYRFSLKHEMIFGDFGVEMDGKMRKVEKVAVNVDYTFSHIALHPKVLSRVDIEDRGKYLEVEYEHPTMGYQRMEIAALCKVPSRDVFCEKASNRTSCLNLITFKHNLGIGKNIEEQKQRKV